MTIAAQLEVQVQADNAPLTRGLQSASGSIRDFADGVSGHMERAGASLTDLGGGILGLTSPLIAFGAAGIQAAAGFEDTLTQISARTGIVGADLEAIKQAALDMGASTVFSGQQVLDTFLELTTSGATTAEAMAQLPAVLNAAAAGGIELAVAADYITNILSTFGLEATDAGLAADALARASGASSASMGDLGEAFSNVGGVAATFGLDVDETAATLAVFADAGIKGAEAGTQLRSLLLNLNRDTPEVTAAWNELGVSLYDTQGNAREWNTILTELDTALARLPVEEQNRLMDDLGGSYGIVGLTALLGADGIGAMTDKMAEQQAAAAIAQAQMATFNQQINSLKGSFQALGIQVMGPFIEDVLKPFVVEAINATNGVIAWTKANPELTSQIVQISAGVIAFGGGALALGGIISALSPVVAGLGIAAAFVVSPIGLLAVGIGAVLYAAQSMYPGGIVQMFKDGATAIRDFGASFPSLSINLQSLADNMNIPIPDITGNIQLNVWDAIDAGLTAVALLLGGPAGAAIGIGKAVASAISNDFLGIATYMESIGLPTTLDGVVSTVTSFVQNAFNSGFSVEGVLDFAGTLLETIRNQFAGISVDSLGIDFSWLTAWASGIDLTAILQAGFDFAGTILSVLGTQMSNLANMELPLIDWAFLGAAIWTGLGSALSLAFDMGLWVATNILMPIFNAFAEVDYSQFIGGALAFGTGLFDLMLNGLPNITRWVADSIIAPVLEALAGLPALMIQFFNEGIPDEISFEIPGFTLFAGTPLESQVGPWGIGPLDLPDNPIPLPARAAGGPVTGGSSYLVGERGPELFTPGRSGMITPNHALAGGGSGGTTVIINSYGDSPGAVADMVRRAVTGATPR